MNTVEKQHQETERAVEALNQEGRACRGNELFLERIRRAVRWLRAALPFALTACGAPLPDECPARPSHVVDGFVQCVSDGCGLGDRMGWSALGCETQMGQWEPGEGCTFQAAYLCANERTATVVYGDGWARFSIEGDGCMSTYMLASEPLDCSAGD